MNLTVEGTETEVAEVLARAQASRYPVTVTGLPNGRIRVEVGRAPGAAEPRRSAPVPALRPVRLPEVPRRVVVGLVAGTVTIGAGTVSAVSWWASAHPGPAIASMLALGIGGAKVYSWRHR
jgi:hypothetical protein